MNLISDIKNIQREDIYSTILMMLFMLNNLPQYSTISELAYVLDHENFINFIKFYEGQTITIPTSDEISESLKVLLVYQYHFVEKTEWFQCLDKAGFKREDSNKVSKAVRKLAETIDEYKIGDYINNEEKNK